MNTSKNTYTFSNVFTNLIGEIQHRQYIRLQAAYGVAQRGGVVFPLFEERHQARLVSDINILSAREHRQLVFSESIFSN
jgi:hypothetical protein